jgi:hypothetical protein
MVPEITPNSANPIPMLEEKVDALTVQLSQLVNSFSLQNQIQSPHPYVHEAQAEDEIGEFLSHHEESKTSGDGKI